MPPAHHLRRSLLDWYDQRRRDLPWRAKRGEAADPYVIWLSEIMLQQTTVATVIGYWSAFLARWPRVEDLAAATTDEVLHAWQGLGYYARARNLHACARRVATAYAGRFPAEEAVLRTLPGIGDYTAAAIAAIAFNQPAVPVDGNVVRVLARLHALETPLPASRREVTRLAARLVAPDRPGDFAQAMMDLGATVCTPRRPRCPVCPWRTRCGAHATGSPEAYPRTAPRREKPVRRGVVFWIERPDGAVLVRRRPPRGLLGGMVEFPSTPWREAAWTTAEAAASAPLGCGWTELPGEVRHAFTHFHLRLSVVFGRCDGDEAAAEGVDGVGDAACASAAAAAPGVLWWCARGRLDELALPTLMKKVAALAAEVASAPALPLAAPEIRSRRQPAT